MVRRFIVVCLIVVGIGTAVPDAAAFTLFSAVTSDANLDTAGNKDGGVSWGDFNNDGCLDVLVNTNDATIQTRLYRSDCMQPAPTFTDVTETYAAGLLREGVTERSAIWGDVNNDGALDFAVNTSRRVEIYLNRGPTATPAYSFGVMDQAPNQMMVSDTSTAVPGGQNTEGMGWIDYDGDGDLDLILDNHNYGIDIYANNGSGTFAHVTPNSDSRGLPIGGAAGDYLTVGDVDVDGDIDVLARKEDAFDLWLNTNGTFTAEASFDEQANNTNKGGVALCDFDNDADFDLFWTDNGANPNQIWRQNDNGSFTATTIPTGISGNIDDVVCGDVDNDGDLDLFLTSNGSDLLLFNELTTSGTLSFTQQQSGITGAADGEGSAFADYDRDGDLDLLINQDGANEMWRNNTNDDNYLIVRALRVIPGTDSKRDDIGATITLLDSDGERVSGVREVNGGRGHGSQDPAYVHFGLPDGPDASYTVRVQFVGGTVVQKTVVPGDIVGYQLVEVTNTPGDNPNPGDNPIGLAKDVISLSNTGFRAYRVVYEITVANLGTAPLTNVQVRDDLARTFERASSFTVNSVTSNDLSVRTDYDGQDVTDMLTGTDTLAAMQQATMTLDVTITLPRASGFFENSATVEAMTPDESIVSDISTNGTNPDPDGDGDPTNDNVATALNMGPPTLTAAQSAALDVDVNANGEANPGDALAYTVVISNTGPGDAVNVRYVTTLDTHTTLVAESVTTTQGAIGAATTPGDSDVSVDIGTIAVGETVTITFRATINNPLPQGVTSVASQGEVQGDNFPTFVTDDPATPEIGDAASVTVVVPNPAPDPDPDPSPGDEKTTIYLSIIYR